MCLEIKRMNIKTAREDIVCYKVLMGNNNDYVTPYFYFPMPLGETFVNNDNPLVIWDSSVGSGFVHQGYFHTFKKLADAKQEAAWFYENDSIYDDVIVVKTIIPKGSHYFSGTNNEDNESYASDKLIVTDIVKLRLV